MNATNQIIAYSEFSKVQKEFLLKLENCGTKLDSSKAKFRVLHKALGKDPAFAECLFHSTRPRHSQAAQK